MVITSVIRKLKHYCRCICIWQCCTTFQDFEPDFVNSNQQSERTTPQPQLNEQQSYFNFIKEPPVAGKIEVYSQTSSTKSKGSSMNRKIDELEALLAHSSSKN